MISASENHDNPVRIPEPHIRVRVYICGLRIAPIDEKSSLYPQIREYNRGGYFTVRLTT